MDGEVVILDQGEGKGVQGVRCAYLEVVAGFGRSVGEVVWEGVSVSDVRHLGEVFVDRLVDDGSDDHACRIHAMPHRRGAWILKTDNGQKS